MLANGYSTSSIQRFISLFQKIIKEYSDIDNLFFSSKNTILPSIENRVLTDKNIRKIITDESKIQDLWILTTGIIPAELSVLTYADINYETASRHTEFRVIKSFHPPVRSRGRTALITNMGMSVIHISHCLH